MSQVKPAFAFIGSPLNRRAEWRTKPNSLPTTSVKYCVWIRGDGVKLRNGQLDLSMPIEKSPPDREMIFLGEDQQSALWFASHADAATEVEPLRGLMQQQALPREHLAILAQARSLVHWHETHGYCAKCGNKSVISDQGYRRHCPACEADHFPRTDPVVIMAIRHQGRILLGRQASWPPGMYSTLAGFLEPGETIEEAVSREVFEEAGLRINNVTYAASQPWPFPASLMIGVMAEAENAEIKIDHHELEDARWFEPADVQQMLDHTHPEGFVASHPYAIANYLIKTCLAV